MLIGYARVSTQDQNLELQCEALIQAGCQKVFEDKVSSTRANSPDLAKALEMLREGDTLVVWKLDRLGHSVKQLVDLVSELRTQGIQFRSLTDSIDTSTPSGRSFFHVMASLAEMERELTVERTHTGLEVAKQLGRKGGRKPKMNDNKIKSAKKLLASGVPLKDVAKNLDVSVPTLYVSKRRPRFWSHQLNSPWSPHASSTQARPRSAKYPPPNEPCRLPDCARPRLAHYANVYPDDVTPPRP